MSGDYKQNESMKLEGPIEESKAKNEKPPSEVKYSQNEMKESVVNDKTCKADRYVDKMTKHDSPPIKHRSLPRHMEDDDVFAEHSINTEQSDHVAEREDEPIESSIDDTEEISNQVVVTPITQPTVKSEVQEAELESHPRNTSDNSDDIANTTTPEKTPVLNKVKKTVEVKHGDTLSPTDVHLKNIHSRENSASSLLEETLESAKTIASIYSVQGPTRSPDGEDCMSTASEMRRHSLAKRVVRRRPKLEPSTFTPERDEPVTRVETSLNEPAVQNEADEDDDAGNRSTGSVSSGGSRPDSGILSPKLEALEEQKVNYCRVLL